MKKFFHTCKNCLNPKVVMLIIFGAIALLVFVPTIGITSLLVAAPLIGCTLMCGAMAFFMHKEKR